MSDLPALWTPSKFDGADLLPVLRAPDPNGEEVVGRDNVSQKDMVLPALVLLQGMSPEVVKGEHPDARPGKILHTGTQQVVKGPIRVLFVHHSKSNLLSPEPNDPRFAGLERCLSRDAITGDRYGDCELCRKCFEWGPRTPANPKGTKPLGAQSHNFVAMTEHGPAIMRFSRTSFQAARVFVTNWMSGSKNLWHHPVVVRVKSETARLPNGQETTYYHWEPVWQLADVAPPQMRAEARRLYDVVEAAFQAGRLAGADEAAASD